MDKLILKNLSATNLADLSNILPSELRDVFTEIFSRVALKGELRQVRMLTSEIPIYFIMTGATEGLGKSGLDYEGWAICNGKNDTEDDGGFTYIGYKKTNTEYSTLNNSLGIKEYGLVKDNLPAISPGDVPNLNQDLTNDGPTNGYGSNSQQKIALPNLGIGLPFSLMQPSKVVLKLQRL